MGAGLTALILGAAAAAAHPPFGFLFGILAYPALMLLAERTLTTRGAFGLGWLAGFAYFFISCWWVAEAFLVNAEAHAWMAPFAASLLPAGLALFWGGAVAIYRRFHVAGHPLRPLLFAAAFCGLEWLRGTILTGFPWNPAGAAWGAGSAASQFAALAGIYGLSLVTVAGASLIGPLFSAGRLKTRVGAAVLGMLMIGAIMVSGAHRLSVARPEASDTTVRIVQADVQQQAKWDAENFEAIVQRYVNLTARPGAQVPDVIVWPEGALPITANEAFAQGSPVAAAMARAVQPGQTLLAGFSRAEPTPKGEWRYFNSLFALSDAGDAGLRVEAVYDKHRLVPFGEYLPVGDLMSWTGLRSLVHVPADFSAGPAPAPLALPGLPDVQPLICYESLYPGFTPGGAARPAWIANVSNDAWFGRTSGPVQHLNLASYRAIETGLPMARATPTGVSALIDPWGRVVPGKRLEPGESGVIDARLPRALAPTLYSRIGDTGFGLMLILALGAGLWPMRSWISRRRSLSGN
ncbi:MAG: apolipoprotein N-acyltransferase [Brevundimonas sp.]|uniref:apolipoprotein N-acyltransferase n=1 Tax=Brevundimonas sp. TaxID=1871086 RepID=UPI00391ADA47